MSFLHTRGSRFNVWWTPYSARWPLLVAWSGGPPAASLARMKRSDIERIALHDLCDHLGVPYRRMVSRVRRTWLHRWDRDPFARGAYSYALVGGSEAAATLARPVGNSLFLRARPPPHPRERSRARSPADCAPRDRSAPHSLASGAVPGRSARRRSRFRALDTGSHTARGADRFRDGIRRHPGPNARFRPD